MPGLRGRWTPAVAAQVRVVARLRARGHTLGEIKQASDKRPARVSTVGPIESLLSGSEARYTLREAARATRAEAAA